MPALRSTLNPKSAAFQTNVQRMSERLAEVQNLEQQVRRESASKRVSFSHSCAVNSAASPGLYFCPACSHGFEKTKITLRSLVRPMFPGL